MNSAQALLQKKARSTPRLFKHNEVFHSLGDAKKMDLPDLNNLLNSIHFVGESIYALLEHPRYEENILVKAYPEPSLDGTLNCRWADEYLPNILPEKSDLLNLVIDYGRPVALVPASLIKMSGDSFSVQLPETSHVITQRQVKRKVTTDVTVDMIQGGFMARGEMVDFCPDGFRVRVNHDSSCSLDCLGLMGPVNIQLHREDTVLFTGSCRSVREEVSLKGKEVVFAPVKKKPARLKKKRIRNPRKRLVPSPTLIFEHPLLKKKIQRDVADLSTSGFCLYEEPEDSVLMRGLVIPDVLIDFAGGMQLKCRAKVVYRSIEKKKGIRCGLSILDMGINDFRCLTDILSKAIEPHAHTCGVVDMDDLWEFFFNTGFIYSQKYRSIHAHRKKFKETYKKLYQENPDIALHFTYQKNGRIHGHMSMVRAYEKSWMIHHHAAMTMLDKRAGFMVLKQIMHCMNNMHRFPSANMEHVMCYFRPESKFPDRVFGGFNRELDDPKRCSMDLFSYFIYPTLSVGVDLPGGWSLGPCSNANLWELNRFYMHRSGGLWLDIMHPRKETNPDETVEKVYSRHGLIRKWKSYALNFHGDLKAVLIVEQSDLGLNLSGLLNSIKIIVTDEENLPWEILSAAIHHLTGVYKAEKVPILIYPHDYLEIQQVSQETKKYMLWIYDARFVPRFMEYLEEKFKIQYWK
jgi:hypothetical protein